MSSSTPQQQSALQLQTTPPRLASGLIDWHSHMLCDRLTVPDGASGLWPGIDVEGESFQLTLGGRRYRPVDARTFDPAARLIDMDAQGVAAQVLSPPPYAVAFDGPPDEFAALARQQNDFLAAVVAERPDRYAMLGLLPFGDPDLVDAEMRRLERTPGVLGICLTAYRDDPLCIIQNEALWAGFAERGWVVFVHPADTAMCECDAETGATFGLGMPLTTARTATVLTLSGLLAAVPETRVLLAHAGGAFPATVHRLERGWILGQHPTSSESPLAAAQRCFWIDSMAYAPQPLQLAADVFGADRIVYGSDYPFTALMTPAELGEFRAWADTLHRVSRNGRSLYDLIHRSPAGR